MQPQKETPEPSEFTKEMREKYKYVIKNKLCVHVTALVKSLNVIDRLCAQHEEDENIYKQVAEHNDILIAENKKLIEGQQAKVKAGS